jgi:hypothetical protein
MKLVAATSKRYCVLIENNTIKGSNEGRRFPQHAPYARFPPWLHINYWKFEKLFSYNLYIYRCALKGYVYVQQHPAMQPHVTGI